MEKKIGRNFEDLECELELSKDIESTKMLILLLQNTEQVLENAALTAALMNYLQNKSQNYNFLLFFYVIQKYEKLNETKNTIKNYHHIHMEIYTVFVHPQAILNVAIKDLVLQEELKESINHSQYTEVFNKAGKYIFDKIITKSIQKFKNSIEMGLETFSFKNKIYADIDRKKELKVLESIHEYIRNSLVRTQKIRCLPHQVSDKKEVVTLKDFEITCIFYALNTQLEYFRQSKKYSYLFKLPTNSTIPNTFLSTTNQNLSKKYKIKGHYFTDFDSLDIETCIVCNVILWGAFPRGLRCNNCKNIVHKDCRETIKTCHDLKKEQKKFQDQKSMSVSKDISDEDSQKFDKNQNKSTEQMDKVEKETENVIENKRIKTDLSLDINTPSESPSKLFFPLTPFRKSQDTKKSTIKSTKSLNVTDVVKNESDLFRSKSARTPSPEKLLVSTNKNLHEKAKTFDTDCETNLSSGVCLEPLITTFWDSDDEMKVSETFEPENELTIFENISELLSTEQTGEYSRLLVLMEFHHKTKFIRMILKRFKYLLVDRWKKLGEFLDIFELLSLDCIDELYRLMKSLVEILDRCRLNNTYHKEIGRNVYSWLTDNDDENLRCWLRLSMDLCCTNVLSSIKLCWAEHKKLYPKLAEILSIEFNRLIVIEQLANMRPLLFNLPMIVGKIVKDLKRFPQYQDEALIWEEVQKKLSYLPRFLDEKCMPVVEMVNSGNIVGSTLKIKNGNNVSKFEKFINNFPRSIFKETFIDFQLVLISNLRELHLVNSKMMQPSVYTKDEIEVAAICYENQMIILQKENEKYILKKFKSFNQKKLNPWITFDKVHVTKRTCRETKNYTHELTILLIDVAVLIQMLFKDEISRDMWFNHVNKKAKRFEKSSSMTVENPILNDLTSDAFVKDNGKTGELLDKLVLNHLIDSSNSLAKSVDVTFERLFKESENKFQKLKTVFQSGPNTSNDFLLSYLHLLHQYAQLGVEMIEESQQRDAQSLIRHDVILFHKTKISDLNFKMDKIINNKKESSLSIFSPIFDTDEDNLDTSMSKKNFLNIQDYIEYIIVQAKESVLLERKNVN